MKSVKRGNFHYLRPKEGVTAAMPNGRVVCSDKGADPGEESRERVVKMIFD